MLPDDELPKGVCKECIENVTFAFNFRGVIINSDTDLKERIHYSKSARMVQFNGSSKSITNKRGSEGGPEEWDDTLLSDFQQTDLVGSPEMALQAHILESRLKEDTVNYSTVNVKGEMISDTNFVLGYRVKLRECNFCNFKTTQQSKWINHQRTFHRERIVCNICGMTVRKDNIKKHIKSHTEGPVPCNQCGNTLKNSESLRGHIWAVHRKFEFRCPLCEKMFTRRIDYYHHKRKQHMCEYIVITIILLYLFIM